MMGELAAGNPGLGGEEEEQDGNGEPKSIFIGHGGPP
jgi:hypothetical protein